MASFLDKFKVTTGISKSTTLDLSCQHVTTSDWMMANPIYIKEMVPGEKLSVDVETFTRLAALKVPTFGRGQLHNRAFFVPMRTIFKSWTDFITAANVIPPVVGDGSANDAVNITTVPFFTNKTLVDLICGTYGTGSTNFTQDVTSSTTEDEGIASRDITLVQYTAATGTNVTYRYYNLTNTGRRMMKLLNSLGYTIQWIGAVDATAEANQNLEAENSVYSALPLLAWLKIMLDWYYPSQYVGDTVYSYVKSLVDGVVSSTGDVHEFNEPELRYIFSTTSVFNGLCNYDSDYFVSAFDNPTGNSQGTTSFRMRDITTDGSSYNIISNKNNTGISNGAVTAQNSETPYIGGISSTGGNTNAVYVLSQYALDSLKAVTDYVKRHQLVGARALDRFYARFGKSLDSEKLDRCKYIGAQNIPIQFGDVMSHSDTEGSNLGDYAGKGIAYGSDGHFDYSTDEYGFFIVINSIVPQVGYYQGVDRTVMHVNRLDFWTPEFDQIGNQAIARKEVYLPYNVVADNDSNIPSDFATGMNGVFGFTPRYSEYKIGRDRLTGDFRYASRSIGDTSDAWHLFRNLGHNFQDSGDMYHSRYFVQGYDGAQYSRIFYTSDGDYISSSTDGADKFYLIHNFTVKSTAPMHALYDTYKFENEGDAKTVVGDVNGVKVN